MTIKFTNNATTTLASGITNVATSLTVASGKGALFPTLSGSDVFYATLANTGGTVEIVKVTARSTDTFTIVRGQDGTSAVAWNTGDKVELRVTAADLGAMLQTADLSTSAVTSAVAGTGIGVSGSTGAVTISNTGVTSLTAGTGISLSGSTGSVTITNSSSASGTVTSVATGNGLSGGTITTSGTLVIAPPSALSVGAYTLAAAGNWISGAVFTLTSGSSYSAGNGNGGVQTVFFSNGCTSWNIMNTLSGTWRYMGATMGSTTAPGGGFAFGGLFCRVA